MRSTTCPEPLRNTRVQWFMKSVDTPTFTGSQRGYIDCNNSRTADEIDRLAANRTRGSRPNLHNTSVNQFRDALSEKLRQKDKEWRKTIHWRGAATAKYHYTNHGTTRRQASGVFAHNLTNKMQRLPLYSTEDLHIVNFVFCAPADRTLSGGCSFLSSHDATCLGAVSQGSTGFLSR